MIKQTVVDFEQEHTLPIAPPSPRLQQTEEFLLNEPLLVTMLSAKCISDKEPLRRNK